MKVLMLTQTLDRADPVLGATHVLAERLARRLERLYVLQLWSGSYAPPDNVVVSSMGKERGAGRARRLATLAATVRDLTVRGEADVVFVHMIPLFAVVAAPIARLAGAPTVLWYHHRQAHPVLRLATRLCSRVVTATPEGFPLRTPKLVVTGHGIDTARFRADGGARQGDGLQVLYVGRISPSKDVETLVRAARLVLDRAGDRAIRFSIRGGPTSPDDERYLARLRALTSSLRLDGAVQFLPAVPYERVAAEYAGCDLFVNLAGTGSADKVVLEAMASARVPLVCNGTFRQILGADAERCFFREHDPSDLAELILRWSRSSADERATVGARLRGSVEREHGIDGLADRLVQIFGEVSAPQVRVSPGLSR